MRAGVGRAIQRVGGRDVDRARLAWIDGEDVEALRPAGLARPRRAAVRAPHDLASVLGVQHLRRRRRDREPRGRLERSEPSPARAAVGASHQPFVRGDVDGVRPRRVDVEVRDACIHRRQLMPRTCSIGAAVQALPRVRLEIERGRLRRRQLERQHERVGRQPVAAPLPGPAGVGAAEDSGSVGAGVENARPGGVDLERRDRAALGPVSAPARRTGGGGAG